MTPQATERQLLPSGQQPAGVEGSVSQRPDSSLTARSPTLRDSLQPPFLQYRTARMSRGLLNLGMSALPTYLLLCTRSMYQSIQFSNQNLFECRLHQKHSKLCLNQSVQRHRRPRFLHRGTPALQICWWLTLRICPRGVSSCDLTYATCSEDRRRYTFESSTGFNKQSPVC